MRILLTTHQFFPDFGAGTEVLTRSVALELVRQGHSVRVMTGFPGSMAMADAQRCDEYEVDGLHVYRFHHAYTPMDGQTSMIALGFDNRLAQAWFARILREFKPDRIHFFHLNRLGSGLIEEGAAQGLPMSMTPTDFWVICPTGQLVLPGGSMCQGPSPGAGNCVKHFAAGKRGGVVGRAIQWMPTALADALVGLSRRDALPAYPQREEVLAMAARLPTMVARLNLLQRLMVPTQFMADLLARYGVEQGRIQLVPYGITQPERPPRQPAGEGAPLRIGFIGTLAPHKGCHVLLEAFGGLPTGTATLQVYGNPDEFPDYSASLRHMANGHSGVTFCGTFPNAKIGEVLNGLDVLVVPSLWYENTPLVVYSAQANRCPVVASELPGIDGVVRDGVDGLLFPAGDGAALRQCLSRLAEDRPLLVAMGKEARPPKSITDYVNDLLKSWSAAGDPVS